MRNIVVTEFVSLDGIIEAPERWSLAYWNDEISRFKHEELFSHGALLLGRGTYLNFAASWPKQKDSTGYANRINSMPKFVASTTLQAAEWQNTQIIHSNLAEEVALLKTQPGQDILVFGSPNLVHSLREADLIDRYQLLVYPVILGKGKSMFQDGLGKAELELLECRVMGGAADSSGSTDTEAADSEAVEGDTANGGKSKPGGQRRKAVPGAQVVLLVYQPKH